MMILNFVFYIKLYPTYIKTFETSINVNSCKSCMYIYIFFFPFKSLKQNCLFYFYYHLHVEFNFFFFSLKVWLWFKKLKTIKFIFYLSPCYVLGKSLCKSNLLMSYTGRLLMLCSYSKNILYLNLTVIEFLKFCFHNWNFFLGC